jgi:hypothetical protein
VARSSWGAADSLALAAELGIVKCANATAENGAHDHALTNYLVKVYVEGGRLHQREPARLEEGGSSMTYGRPALRILSVFLSAAAIAFCSKNSPTEPTQDRITIVSIQPPAGTIL